MALNQDGRVAVFPTLAEAFGLTWRHLLPLVVLAYLMVLPWAAAAALGFLDPLNNYAAVSQGRDLSRFPWGVTVTFWAGGFAIAVIFAIFWYRYLLLGREAALQFGLAQFKRMFAAMAGYGVIVMIIAILLMMASGAVAIFPALILSGVLAPRDPSVSIMLTTGLVLLGNVPALAVVMRLSLTFPAAAVGERLTLKESWSQVRGSTWRLVWTLLLAALPLAILSYGIDTTILFAMGVDPMVPAAARSFWWVTWALSPVMILPMALACAVVALAYRDLSRSRRSAELPAGASLA